MAKKRKGRRGWYRGRLSRKRGVLKRLERAIDKRGYSTRYAGVSFRNARKQLGKGGRPRHGGIPAALTHLLKKTLRGTAKLMGAKRGAKKHMKFRHSRRVRKAVRRAYRRG